MAEVLRTRQSTEFFVQLAKKLAAHSGKKLAPALLMKTMNQAAWDVKAPRYNSGDKDSTDALNGFVLKLRKDLKDLGLTKIFSIGDGRGKGYTISVDADAVANYLDGTDCEEYLSELRKPGPKKSVKLKKQPSSQRKPDKSIEKNVEPKVDIPVDVPTLPGLTIKGKIDLDQVPKGKRGSVKTAQEKKDERVLRNQLSNGEVPEVISPTEKKTTSSNGLVQETRYNRTMSEYRRIYGIAGIVRLFGGEIKLDFLYDILKYNTFYKYNNLNEKLREKNVANLRLLITSAYDDVFVVTRDTFNNLIVKFKRDNSWERVKRIYQGRVITAQFAVRTDIGYDWDEEYLKPFVRKTVKVNSVITVVTLSWDLTVTGFQDMILNCADALDGSKIISYRVNQQNIVEDEAHCNKVLYWIYEVDEFTREYGLVKNSVEIDNSLGLDIIKALKLSGSNLPAINNRLFFMMERL